MDQVDPDLIKADGDGGDSGWMNEAPRAWTRDPSCDMRALPGVNHIAIITCKLDLSPVSEARCPALLNKLCGELLFL
jgi:hypothetical protein